MQMENGEFIPEKDLSKNYRIPKRKAEDDTGPNIGLTSPLPDPSTCMPYVNPYYNYYNTNANGYYNMYPPTGQYPLPPQEPNVDPVTQNIFKTLNSIKEKPKTYNKNIFEATVPDLTDESLPKELRSMFQPLFCKLCTAQLSSNVNARMHYNSKNHEKKIKKWLVEHSEKTGEPLHKRARISKQKLSEEEKNPLWFHCDLCDIPLTGKLHAESHYMGKSHQRAVVASGKPNWRGIKKKAKPQQVYFEEGQDTFGLDFNPERMPAQPLIGPKAPSVKPQTSRFYCEVCAVNTTCQEQLDEHCRGQRHQKKVRSLPTSAMQQTFPVAISETLSMPCAIATPNGGIPAPPPPPMDMNLSVYRTPSGDFYCPTCNSTCNSEMQFIQHMRSKSHLKKQHAKK